jgi:hypothetical protein
MLAVHAVLIVVIGGAGLPLAHEKGASRLTAGRARSA